MQSLPTRPTERWVQGHSLIMNPRARNLSCNAKPAVTHISVGHRPIKIPKDGLFQLPSGPWSDAGLVSHCFYDAPDKPAIVFPPNHASGQPKDRRADKFIRTTGSPCYSWSDGPCIVHGRSALCFVCALAETKNNFMASNNSTVAIQGLIISDMNFIF